MIWLGVIVLLIMAALGAPLFSVLLGAAMLNQLLRNRVVKG